MKRSECSSCRNSSIKSDERHCIHTCIGCGYYSLTDVECMGIYHCPNPLCRATGASWVGRLCKSKIDDPNGRGFTVDSDEVREIQLAEVRKVDPELLAFLREKYPDDVAEAFRDQPIMHIGSDPGDEQPTEVA